MTCLDTAIGLSQTTCNCFEDTPDGYNTSESGVFIDNVDGFNIVTAQSAADCDKGGVWDIMSTARDNAIKQFNADLQAQIGVQPEYRRTIENISYTIGSQKYTTSYNPGTVYGGVRLVPRQINNGIIKISSVKLIFNATIVVQCRIFNNLSDTPLHSFTVSCVANTATASAALNYELPMYVAGEEIEYYLVYEFPVTARPLQNKIVCSQCLHWNIQCCDTPCFGSRTVKDQTWNNNLMIGGISGDTWEDLEDATGISNQNNGIILNLSMTCDYESVICSNFDFTIPCSLAFAGAWALAYKSAYNAYQTVLSSKNISREIMIDRERMMQLCDKWIKEYNNRILWLAQNMEMTDSGCYTCEPRIIKAGILA